MSAAAAVPHQGFRINIPNVPPFFMDAGPATNAWHNERGITPEVEPWQTQIFLKLLTDAPKFLDIGANIGWYSLITSAYTHRAEIHAFEPEPNNLTILKDNIRVNGFDNVSIWPFALGAKEAKLNLYISEDNIGDHRLGADDSRASISVDVRRLDSVTGQAGFTPDLVKIDVQGAEVMVFEGAKDTFLRGGHSMAMLIEFQPEALGMENARTLIDRLAAFNRPMFEIYPFDGGQLRPLSKEALSEALEGCLNPRYDSHIDILVAPYDYRLDRIRPLIGPDFVQWTPKSE